MSDFERRYYSGEGEVRESGEYRYSRRGALLARLMPNRPAVNAVLFVLTIFSTLLVGGLTYSLSIISILLAHEMGHYLMCRRHGVHATLPYFLPFPFFPFGTLGAVIRMDARIPNRRVLFDIAVAGPLAGLVVTLPVLYFGLQNSEIVSKATMGDAGVYLGESLLFKYIAKLAIPNLATDFDIILNPMAYAGWVGLFVTALNLLPIGQLDGGHVLYALFGRGAQKVYLFALIGFAAVCVVLYPGWALLLLLLVFFGYKHPPPMDNWTQLDSKRRLLGVGMLVLFAISFTPVPFRF